MNRAEKISGGAVLLLMALAAMLMLIQHFNVARLRTVPADAAELGASTEAGRETLHRRGASGAVIAPGFHFGGGADLTVPVRGIRRRALVDTWGAARAEGRRHQGIDILAPMGTPVLAARDGRIVRFFDSARGGVTIYQVDPTENYIFYYAHLLARTPGLREGDQVRQGQVIGSVGTTGNATTPHLHFEIGRLGADKNWWRAEPVNPYPYLLNGEAPR